MNSKVRMFLKRRENRWCLLFALVMWMIALVLRMHYLAESPVLRARNLSPAKVPSHLYKETTTTSAEEVERVISCDRLFAGDPVELQRSKKIHRPHYSTGRIITDARTCDQFVTKHQFITDPLTDVEKRFPIAYSIVVHRDPPQVLDLLKTIYRPQNYYCIHVDLKANKFARKAFEAIADCFDNVFLSSRSVRVHWGKFSVLETDLICMADLMKHPGWKYFINLTGQEFPLKTNLEIVTVLKSRKGTSDVSVRKGHWMDRLRWKHALPAPHNLTVKKGSVHVALSRAFVHYTLTSPVANAFLNWTRGVKVPDELFFNTLSYNLQPGIDSIPQLNISDSFDSPYPGVGAPKPYVTRFKNWKGSSWPCADRKYVRMICILSAGDLPSLDKRPELFANKFHMDYSYWARTCLAQKLLKRTIVQTSEAKPLNRLFFTDLAFKVHRKFDIDFE